MTYTAKMLMSGDLEISEDGKLAAYLYCFDDASARSVMDSINGLSVMAGLEIEVETDDEGTCVRVYDDDEFVAYIVGAEIEESVDLGRALIKQIEGV